MDSEEISKIVKLIPYISELRDADEPIRQSELRRRVDTSKSTAHRATKHLEQEGIISNVGGGYALTEPGELIAEITCGYVSEIKATDEYREFLSIVRRTDLSLSGVSDAKVTRASSRNPVAPLVRLAEITAGADKVRVLTNSIAPESFEVGRQGIREGEKSVEMVVDRRTIDSIRGSEWFGEELKKDLRTDNFSLWIHEEPVSYQIGLMDGKLCLGAEDENRMPVAMLETENTEAVGWARDVFDKYRRRSDRLKSTDV